MECTVQWFLPSERNKGRIWAVSQSKEDNDNNDRRWVRSTSASRSEVRGTSRHFQLPVIVYKKRLGKHILDQEKSCNGKTFSNTIHKHIEEPGYFQSYQDPNNEHTSFCSFFDCNIWVWDMGSVVGKADHKSMDSIEICCWRRMLRISWTKHLFLDKHVCSRADLQPR